MMNDFVSGNPEGDIYRDVDVMYVCITAGFFISYVTLHIMYWSCIHNSSVATPTNYQSTYLTTAGFLFSLHRTVPY